MDWMALIASLFGQGTTTTSPKMMPEMEAAIKSMLTGANAAYTRPYKPYTGDRTANPTASRASADQLMATVGQQVNRTATDANGYKARIANLMNGGPARVSVPSMVPGGAQVGYQGQAPVAPVPTRVM